MLVSEDQYKKILMVFDILGNPGALKLLNNADESKSQAIHAREMQETPSYITKALDLLEGKDGRAFFRHVPKSSIQESKTGRKRVTYERTFCLTNDAKSCLKDLFSNAEKLYDTIYARSKQKNGS